MKKMLLTFLLGTGFVFAADLELGVHPSFISGMMDTKLADQVQPIQKNSNGVVTSGQATTKASAELLSVDNSKAWEMGLEVKAMTTAFTHSYSWPLRTVVVDVDASIASPSVTKKQVYFSESGFQSSPAQSSVSSSIQYSNLNVCASGIFWKIKENIVYRRAEEELMAQKCTQEAEVSKEIATQLNQKVDQIFADQTSKFQKDYQESFYTPVIEKGGLKGKVVFASGKDAFLASADLSGTNTKPEFKGLSKEQPISARLSIALLNRLLEANASDRTFTGDDVAKAIGGESTAETAGIKLVMAKQAPVVVTTQNRSGRIVFHMASMVRGASEMKQIEVALPFKLESENGKILMDLNSPAEIRSLAGAEIKNADMHWINETFRLMIPEIALEVSEMKLNLFGKVFKPKKFDLVGNGLDLTLGE